MAGTGNKAMPLDAGIAGAAGMLGGGAGRDVGIIDSGSFRYSRTWKPKGLTARSFSDMGAPEYLNMIVAAQ